MSYAEICRDIRRAKKEARARHGIPCPMCQTLLPKAPPSILLPQQRCKIHGYKDERKRTTENEYLPMCRKIDIDCAFL